jgi:hypothetical protein
MSIALGLFEQNLVIVNVSGVLMRTELDQAKKWVFEHIQQHGKIVALVVIEPEFNGLQEFVEWQDIEYDEYIQQHTKALAVVGSEQWSEDAILFLLGGLLPFPIKYFQAKEYPLAEAWLLGH